jgi:hypothetical protein
LALLDVLILGDIFGAEALDAVSDLGATEEQRHDSAPAMCPGLFCRGVFIPLECRCGAALLPEACHEGA